MPSILPGWQRPESPFHAGELAIQERLGVREKIDGQVRRAGIREIMPDQHRDFFVNLPFIVVGGADATGQPWATILPGPPGFISAPGPAHLRIEALPGEGDPLAGQFRPGDAIGLLGIELPTRRRNRFNGRIAALDASGFAAEAEQTFGNCAKYIQIRGIELSAAPTPPGPAVHRPALNAQDRALIARADTFFIASAHHAEGPGQGVDVSHRGGKPGFVRSDGANILTIPDFAGNLFFNTLGNLTLDPRAGLLFLDFETGDLLWIAAKGKIIWDGPDLERFAGAERLVQFETGPVIFQQNALPLRGSQPDLSPFLVRIGNWAFADD